MPKYESPVGDLVVCDGCSKDYTTDLAPGGLLFAGKAYGPCCATRIEALARRYDEDRYIVARCPEGMPFSNWVRADLRPPGPATITIYTGQDADDVIDRLRGGE